MDNYDFPTDSKRVRAAKERLQTRFNLGRQAQAELVNAVANMHIKDKLVDPKAMSFYSRKGKALVHYTKPGLLTSTDPGISVHPHALTQMASVAGIPKLYVNRLLEGEPWEIQLFDHNMNKLFHEGKYLDRKKNPTRFLHRLVGDEVRGFLSRNFNRHLASLPLLKAFVVSCQELGAEPIEAVVSPIRFSLKMYLPYIFEPVDGEFIAIGQCWSNSDFGAGRLKLSLTVLRVSSGTASVLEDTLSRVHIGSVIQDSDIELSEGTAIKEVEAQCSAIHDAVHSQLAPEPVNRIVQGIRVAQEESIPWYKLKEALGRVLSKKEVENVKSLLDNGIDSIVDLPPPKLSADGPLATRWWAANVLSWLSGKEGDADRKLGMQEVAGELLGVAS